MDKQYLKDVFSKLKDNPAWSLQMVQIKNSKKHGVLYICREVEITPEHKLLEYLERTVDYYCSEKGIDAFSAVDDYTGDVVDHVIYKLEGSNQLIEKDLKLLFSSTGNPDKEIPLEEFKPNAGLYKGTISINDVEISVMLISMQRPITALSNKLIWLNTNKFREINEPVLTLRKTIDVAIVGDTVFFFTLAGERLFDLERTYKAICKSQVDDIAKCDFLSDTNSFIDMAGSGRNPRRFISYNKEHFEWLKNADHRRLAAKKFGFVMDGDKIDTGNKQSVEKLVKFLCNKAMVDPCDSTPVEVSAAKPWG